MLTMSAYKNIALKTFGDLDILLQKQDFARTRELLTAAGYMPKYPPNSVKEALWLRSATEY